MRRTGTKYFLVPVLVTLLGLLVTVTTTALFRRTTQELDRARFEYLVDQRTEAINQRLESYIALLRAGASFVGFRREVSRHDWEVFAKSMRLAELYPGAQGFGFAKVIAPGEREAVTRAMRAQGYPNFSIHPRHERADYTAILFLEPLDRRNEAAIGYDMFSEPTRREAMERARDTGLRALSGKVELVQEIDPNKQPGFLIYVPAYEGAAVPTTVEQRRALLLGWIYSPFRAGDLFSRTFGEAGPAELIFSVFDGEPSPAALLYSSGPSNEVLDSAHAAERDVEIGGRRWRLSFASTPAFELGSSNAWWPYVLGAGLVVTWFLSAASAAQAQAARKADSAREALADTTSSLSRERERLAVALRAGQLGVYEWRVGDDWVWWSPETYPLFGVDPASFTPTLKAFSALIHPDDRAELWRKTEESIARGDVFVHEYRIIRSDGTVRWIANRSHCGFDALGRVERITGVAVDITERREHEEQVQLLMREVNHRAKNMLSVIQAIARQTAARNPGSFVDSFEDRLQALSACQDLLVESEWKAVWLHDLVRSQVGHLGEAFETRIVLKGPAVRVMSSASQPIAMALHELSTNAAKYGALSNDLGRIEITWELTAGDNGAPQFAMSWIERNGPPVSKPERLGFGSKVVSDIVKATLGGDVTLDYAAAGLGWRFRCLAEKVVEPAPPRSEPAVRPS